MEEHIMKKLVQTYRKVYYTAKEVNFVASTSFKCQYDMYFWWLAFID